MTTSTVKPDRAEKDEKAKRINATYEKMPREAKKDTPVHIALRSSIRTGRTSMLLGSHGIAKSALVDSLVPQIAAEEGFDDAVLIKFDATNIAPDDLVTTSPFAKEEIKEGSDEPELVWYLRDFLLPKLIPGKKFVLFIDDSRQAHPLVQQQIMQLTCDWQLGNFKLREFGCVGVIMADNPSLTETSTLVDDFAQLDRFYTFKVTDQETAAVVKLYLSNKYSDVDLKPVFAVRDTLPAAIRHIVSWRTLDHMIEMVLDGYPAKWALPVLDGTRVPLESNNDGRVVDRTDEILEKFTQALGMQAVTNGNLPRLLSSIMSIKGRRIRVVGPPGSAKTAYVQAMIDSTDIDLINWSLPVTNFDSHVVPLPTDEGIKMVLSERLQGSNRKVILLDEYTRPASPDAHARAMELVQDFSLGGVDIPELQAVIALENPPNYLDFAMAVRSPNISQADRFTATVLMEQGDIDSRTWLLNSFPSQYMEELSARPVQSEISVEDIKHIAEVALDWHAELDDTGRKWVTYRGLERLIRANLEDIPLEAALVHSPEGTISPIHTQLPMLRARFAKVEYTGMKQLTRDVDEWVAKLQASDEESGVGLDNVIAVNRVFSTAPLDLLVDNRMTVLALVPHMPRRFVSKYLTSATEDQRLMDFWRNVVAHRAGKLTDEEFDSKLEAEGLL